MTGLCRLSLGLRWLLLAPLAVCLVASPVLVLVGQMHAQAHLTTTNRGPAVKAQTSEYGLDVALHRLQQLVLCCIQTGPTPEILLAVEGIGRYLQLLKPGVHTYPHKHPIAPFRPPIAG